MSEQMQGITSVVNETSELTIPDAIKLRLVEDLGPIAARIDTYTQAAAHCRIATEHDAQEAAELVRAIDADIKAVTGHEVMSGIISGLHGLHRRWTAARSLFADPMEAAKRQIRGRVLAWQNEQKRLADEATRKAQAEADERARVERERLERAAAKLKTPELREARLAEAAMVQPPTVIVNAPKSGLRSRKVWRAVVKDEVALFRFIAENPMYSGFVEVRLTNLERAKGANNALTVPGVVFTETVV